MKKHISQTTTKLMFIIYTLLIVFNLSCSSDAVKTEPDSETDPITTELDLSTKIPPGGNSWVVNDFTQNESIISDNGLHNWADLNSVIRTYFKTSASGNLHVGLNIKVPSGISKIKVTVGNETKNIEVSNTNYADIEVGMFNIQNPGYHYIEIQGLEKDSNYIADVNNVLIGGPATSSGITFVADAFYWGRRGPSVHLAYDVPEDKDVQWFYNEITVPEGQDVIGSYFMANGFGQGYFGMQVNSETERRVLFSVWSPYDTQNPNDIPEDYRIILLGNGTGVTIGEFGNEGSGGQSYKVFDWEPGNTYKFLLKGEPSVNNSTDYTAYFYAPETGEWQLIASFRRPHTSTYLTNMHSFLENFNTETGFLSRQGEYTNQWVYDTQGEWQELTSAKFTADATARSGARLDYAGGAIGNKFFMKNCGFFSENTTIDSHHSRTANGNAPVIDFSELEIPDLPEDTIILDKTGWSVIDFSSEATAGEGSNGLASLVIDNNNTTYWHSCWSECDQSYNYPHHLTIDMTQEQIVKGFEFIQRNGSRKVKDIEIQVSLNDVSWESLGDFVLTDTAGKQNIDLALDKSFRYFKIIAKSAHDGQQFAAFAEISPF